MSALYFQAPEELEDLPTDVLDQIPDEIVEQLRDGVIDLKPLEINIPGGDVNLSLQLAPGERSSRMSATAKVDRLDYGVLARRIDPASKVGGLIWVDVDLSLKGPPGGCWPAPTGTWTLRSLPKT